MKEPKIAVVILNWNGVDFLEKFLPCVLQHSADTTEVIVADNASTDDSVMFMQQHFPEVRLIRNEKNFGFAEGYNTALKQVDADYYILLNSDVEVTPNWIDPVIQLMEKEPAIAACQPKLCSWHQRQELEYAGAGGGFIDKLGYPFCRGRLFQTLEKDEGQYDDISEVFWASGACMFVRAPVYWEVNGLDGDFFAHMEEIDFCWRLKNRGYKIMYCGLSTVYHVGGGTLPKNSTQKTYLNIRNNLIMLYKNLPKKQLHKTFFIRTLLDGIAAFYFFVTTGNFRNFWSVVRAHVDFIKSKKQTKMKRQNMENQIPSQIYDGNIVVNYYLFGKRHFCRLNPKKFGISKII
jgi:GT2 family glycosyltransferase